jgi:hypothetical protein
MSTSETVKFDVGPCPCGRGKITKHVTTQDNPWSSADISHSISCGVCASDWHIDYGRLVQRSTEAPYRKAYVEEQAKYHELDRIVYELTEQYFLSFGAATKKAEHAEMTRLGIFDGNYRSYLRARANGASAGKAASPLRNEKWIAGLARNSGRYEQFHRALLEYQSAQARTRVAEKKIVTRPLESKSPVVPD